MFDLPRHARGLSRWYLNRNIAVAVALTTASVAWLVHTFAGLAGWSGAGFFIFLVGSMLLAVIAGGLERLSPPRGRRFSLYVVIVATNTYAVSRSGSLTEIQLVVAALLLMGVSLGAVQWTHRTLVRGDFAGAIIDSFAPWDGDFREYRLRKALFYEVDAAGASFHGSDLRGAMFVRCNLQGAVFYGARVWGAKFIECTLGGAKGL